MRRRSYNGLPVGPTLRVKPGDTLRITVNNQLGTEPPTAIGQYYTSKQKPIGNRTGDWFHDYDVYSHPNVTNLHLHGLHVDPNGNGDNVMLAIQPTNTTT